MLEIVADTKGFLRVYIYTIIYIYNYIYISIYIYIYYIILYIYHMLYIYSGVRMPRTEYMAQHPLT